MNQVEMMPSTNSFRTKLPLLGSLLVVLFAAGVSIGAEPSAQAPGSAPLRKTSFAEVTSQLDPGGSVFLYLATDQWLTGLSTKLSRVGEVITSMSEIPDENREPMMRAINLVTAGIRGSGMESLNGVGVSSAPINPELHRSKLILYHKPGQGEGWLWDLFGRQAHPLRAMDLLPRTTAVAAFGDLDLARLWSALPSALSDAGMGEAATVREWQRGFEHGFGEEAKLPWTNALASFGGEGGIILTLDDMRKINRPIGGQSIELPEPGLILAIKVNDDTLFNRVSQELKANPQTEVTEEQGIKMCVMPLDLPLPVPVKLAVATGGGYLFVATSPELVRMALEAQSGRAAGLVQSPEFKALRQHLPAEGNQFLYISRRFSELVRQGRKQADESEPKPIRQLFVLRDLLLGQETSYGLAVGGRTPTGWQMVSVGNRDSSGALLLAPVVGCMAVPAAMLLPALNNAKDRAQRINCANNMKQISLAFKIWAIDNEDALPFNLPASKGGTLDACARGDDGFDQNAWRHFQVLSNELIVARILVCPSDTKHQPAADFGSLGAANVTYLLRSGTNINDTHPQEVLLRCPIHSTEALCDGSVVQRRTK